MLVIMFEVVMVPLKGVLVLFKEQTYRHHAALDDGFSDSQLVDKHSATESGACLVPSFSGGLGQMRLYMQYS
jgi:hypothetical protein